MTSSSSSSSSTWSLSEDYRHEYRHHPNEKIHKKINMHFESYIFAVGFCMWYCCFCCSSARCTHDRTRIFNYIFNSSVQLYFSRKTNRAMKMTDVLEIGSCWNIVCMKWGFFLCIFFYREFKWFFMHVAIYIKF